MTASGITRFTSSSANRPTNITFGTLFTQVYSASNRTLLAIATNSDGIARNSLINDSWTGWVDVVTADSAGDVAIEGGLVFGDAGGSGASSSNTFDSYEEGSWTPVISDAAAGGNTGSASTVQGFYTKSGRLVSVYAFIVNITTTGMTSGNVIYFQGLPFTSDSTNAGRSQGAVRADQVVFGGYITSSADNNSTVFMLTDCTSGSPDTDVTVADFTSGASDLFVSFTYNAA